MSSVAAVPLEGELSSLDLLGILLVISELMSSLLVVVGLKKSAVSACLDFLAFSSNVVSTTTADTANSTKNRRSFGSPSSRVDPKCILFLIATAVLLAICLGASKRAESSASDVAASVKRWDGAALASVSEVSRKGEKNSTAPAAAVDAAAVAVLVEDALGDDIVVGFMCVSAFGVGFVPACATFVTVNKPLRFWRGDFAVKKLSGCLVSISLLVLLCYVCTYASYVQHDLPEFVCMFISFFIFYPLPELPDSRCHLVGVHLSGC